MSVAPAPVPIGPAAARSLLAGAPRVRAINFHSTPAADRDRYLAQLAGLGQRYGPVDETGLDRLLAGEPLPHGRPGLLPVLYEGYRNNYEVALELIEREGLIAWIFLPSAFPGVPVAEQRAFAEAHEIGLAGDEQGPVAMSWAELRDVVARGHVVACHTASHSGISDLRAPEDVERELAESTATIARELGITVRSFAWLWGSPAGVAPRLDARLRCLGYRFVFSNTKIQRLAPWPAEPPTGGP